MPATILASLLVPAFLMLAFARKWTTIALGVVLLLALLIGSNELLNRRAVVQRAPEPGPHKSKLGRWFQD